MRPRSLGDQKSRATLVTAGARVLLPLVALALSGCESHTCPDPELAEGTWVPAGGTIDFTPTVAASVTEVYVSLSLAVTVLDPSTGAEMDVSAPIPTDVAAAGFAATPNRALL